MENTKVLSGAEFELSRPAGDDQTRTKTGGMGTMEAVDAKPTLATKVAPSPLEDFLTARPLGKGEAEGLVGSKIQQKKVKGLASKRLAQQGPETVLSPLERFLEARPTAEQPASKGEGQATVLKSTKAADVSAGAKISPSPVDQFLLARPGAGEGVGKPKERNTSRSL